MTAFLYWLVVFPCEYYMQTIFTGCLTLFHSCGLAIVGTSVITTVLCAPFFKMVHTWQEEQEALKTRMKPKAEMIRRCFKGQERFAMLSTMRRQAGFSYLKSWGANLNILLVILIFIGSWITFSNMPLLNGVTFGPIHNLDAPDGLLAFAEITVNLLPLLMTITGLAVIFCFMRGISRARKVLFYTITILLFFLLYNSSAALTLYWFINNLCFLLWKIIQRIWPKNRPANNVHS